MSSTKDRQISVRVSAETDRWLERQAGGIRGKASFLRQLIERERARQKQQERLEMFDRAARDVTEEDRAERDALLGAFSGQDESR